MISCTPAPTIGIGFHESGASPFWIRRSWWPAMLLASEGKAVKSFFDEPTHLSCLSESLTPLHPTDYICTCIPRHSAHNRANSRLQGPVPRRFGQSGMTPSAQEAVYL